MAVAELDRLYELLPAAIRRRDADIGEPLRALLGVLATEINAIEDDIETTWDNWFIETCEEWLVPYIGDALGLQGLRNLDTVGFSLRSYVANTLERRRRKGTISATEQLARDVTGYPTRAVEMFALTSTTANVNHVRHTDAEGVVLGTLDVRNPALMLRVAGPFDPFVHTPDVRSMTPGLVRHNLANVELFLWRLRCYELSGATARADAGDPRWFRFDALGADRSIFNLPVGEDTIVSLAGPEHVPRPIGRLELGAFDVADDWPIAVSAEIDDGAGGVTVTDLIPHVCHLGGTAGGFPARQPADADHVIVDPMLGRLIVHQDLVDAGLTEVVVDLVHGFPGDIGAGPADRNAGLEQLGADVTVRFQIGVARHPQVVGTETIVETLEEAVVAWNAFIAAVPAADRASTAGVIVVMDSRSHVAPTTPIECPDGCTVSLVAASWPRTDVDGVLDRHQGVLDANRLRPHVAGDIAVGGQASAAGTLAGDAVLDGLLIEGTVIVRPGELGRLIMRSCTIARTAVGISVESGGGGANARLAVTVERSIVPALVATDPIAGVIVTDSFVGAATTAIDAPGATLDANGSTLVGTVRCQIVEASDCIFDEGDVAPEGSFFVAQTQQGCIRFSSVPVGAATPRRYRCQPDLALEGLTDPVARRRIVRAMRPVFGRDLADPAFGVLTGSSAAALHSAGSGGSEPGMWNHLHHARRMTNLRLALGQDLRFGLDAGFVLDRGSP